MVVAEAQLFGGTEAVMSWLKRPLPVRSSFCFTVCVQAFQSRFLRTTGDGDRPMDGISGVSGRLDLLGNEVRAEAGYHRYFSLGAARGAAKAR